MVFSNSRHYVRCMLNSEQNPEECDPGIRRRGPRRDRRNKSFIELEVG